MAVSFKPRVSGIGATSPLAAVATKDRNPPRADLYSDSNEGPLWGHSSSFMSRRSSAGLAPDSGQNSRPSRNLTGARVGAHHAPERQATPCSNFATEDTKPTVIERTW